MKLYSGYLGNGLFRPPASRLLSSMASRPLDETHGPVIFADASSVNRTAWPKRETAAPKLSVKIATAILLATLELFDEGRWENVPYASSLIRSHPCRDRIPVWLLGIAVRPRMIGM
jgi:hypothetical protein